MLLDVLEIILENVTYDKNKDLVQEVIDGLNSEGEYTLDKVSREALNNLHALKCKYFVHYDEEIDNSQFTALIQVSPLLLLEAERTQGSYSDEEWDATLRLILYREDSLKKRLEQEAKRIEQAMLQLTQDQQALQQLQD
jgi:hypothetical protein